MAKYTGSVCRLCRREGMKLFLKGERCYTDKCAFERRAYGPGQHGQARKKPTEYGTQLREKQKVKRIYGLLERQFRQYFGHAEKAKGITGENLLLLLERRLDNMVYRMGFATSRSDARQKVEHNHIVVNKRRVNVPSYQLKQGDTVTISNKSKKATWLQDSLAAAERRGIPEWLKVDKDKLEATLTAYPTRDQITMPINEQMIVELYSK